MSSIVHEIAPVWNEESRVLILGPMPSPASRNAGFFSLSAVFKRHRSHVARAFDMAAVHGEPQRPRLFEHGVVEPHIAVGDGRRIGVRDGRAVFAPLLPRHDAAVVALHVLDRAVPVRMHGEARIGGIPGATASARAEPRGIVLAAVDVRWLLVRTDTLDAPCPVADDDIVHLRIGDA